ncbi:MAG: DUF3368 domain-containing protein, partial [Nitrospirae bacterium]|nr:DUF3368 domain-containing protein [Nitrospirota bacterium]
DIWPWPDYAKRYLHSASFTGFATGSHSSPSLKARGFLAVLIKPLIRQIKAVGFWISDDVQEAILKHSNELDN